LLFMLAGALYIGGAVGMELIAGPYAERYGMQNFGYSLLAMTEEAIEMTGIALFTYALLAFGRDHIGAVAVYLGDQPASLPVPRRALPVRGTPRRSNRRLTMP